MTDARTDYGPPVLSLPALFLLFLRFGCLAFGGPVAQIAMIRESLIEKHRWIAPGRFNRLLAVLQILPGPEAHELCVHLGMVARGRIGGLLAGVGFMLPGFLLMLLAGWIYATWIAGSIAASSALAGVQIAVLAIITRAVVRIGQHIIENRLLAGVAILSLAATLAGASFWIVLAAGGLAYALSHRPLLAFGVLALAAIGVAGTFLAGPVTPDGPMASAAAVTLPALFLAGLKGGLLTFGGAYTAIPYVRADTVGRGWLSDATFLDGVAIAGILPAPLVIFATFVGYVVGGPCGAVAITIGMFLPAFAFSLIFFERLEAVIENPALHRLLAGVAAAVVGIIAATVVQLGVATAGRVTDVPLAVGMFGIALLAAWRLRGPLVTPAILASGAIAGWLVTP